MLIVVRIVILLLYSLCVHSEFVSEFGDLRSFTIRLPPDLDAPKIHTTYVCQQYKIPDYLLSETFYITRFSPIVDNEDVLHHMIVFGCTDGTEPTDPHECGGREATCRSFLTTWSLGFDRDTNLYKNTGIPIGKNGYKTLSLQIHWNNDLLVNVTDSSGMEIYYTSTKPMYELGNVQIGQDLLELHPGQANLNVTGGCSSYCSYKYNSRPFYITRTFIHLHALGVAGQLNHYRNGRLIQTIANDPFYSYKRPPVHDHLHAIKILPGDEVKLTCWFDTKNGDRMRNHTIYWGEGTNGEMCYAFVSYFPKSEGFDQCVQFDDYDQCDNYNQQSLIMGDCNFKTFLFDTSGDIATLRTSCDESALLSCNQKCVESVNNIYRHSCMQGSLGIFLKKRVASTVNWKRLASQQEYLSQHCML